MGLRGPGDRLPAGSRSWIDNRLDAHRFLWFRWGNATAPVAHEQTTFTFAGPRDPTFLALKARLERTAAVRDEPFVQPVEGVGEAGPARRLVVYGPGPLGRVRNLRMKLAHIDERLHHGQIHWWIRLGSWLILAVPAWFVRPWLALPAIALVEAAWVVGLQWSWHRDRWRRRPSPSGPGR